MIVFFLAQVYLARVINSRAKSLVLLVLLPILGVLPGGAKPAGPEAVRQDKVGLEFFFEEGCDSCTELRRTVLPELELHYAGCYDLMERDIGIESNYLALVHYQEAARIKDNEPVSIVVDGREYLPGVACIRSKLFPALEKALAQRLSGGQSDQAGPGSRPADVSVLKQRVDRFTLLGVIAVAAVDSLNPCAISALVFFVSLMAAARLTVARMWTSGLAFLAGCFLTYFALGLGLLKLLGSLVALREWRRAIDLLLMSGMVGLAALSFRDALRYHRTGQGADVFLKLPPGMQNLVHRIMQGGLRSHHWVLGGFGIGVAVTLLESVCTGQVYVPALAMMLKSGHTVWRCTFYLLVYNAVFVMPLLIVLWLTCAGLRTAALVAWSRHNVVASKILLGGVFVGLTILMLLIR